MFYPRLFPGPIRHARATSVCALVLALALGCGTASAPDPSLASNVDASSRPTPKVVLLSWDGAADWVVDRLLKEGALPHLAALAEEGVRASNRPPFPSKTAPGHATLWTGCWPSVHGVTGNRVPARPFSEHTLLESADGFLSTALQMDPIFLTAALAGKKVAVLSATQQYPPHRYHDRLRAAGVPTDHLMTFSGFTHRVARGTMLGAEGLRPAGQRWRARLPPFSLPGALELEVEVADSKFFAVVFDDPKDSVAGLDTLLLESAKDGSTALLKPRTAGTGLEAWSQPLAVVNGDLEGNTLFRLFSLAPDGSELALYQRAASFIAGAGDGEREQAYRKAYAAFHDDPFRLYSRGGLGPTLMDGGSGAAERRVLELVALDRQLLTEGASFVLRSWGPDLLMHYSPMADSAGHAWMGYLDPRAEGHDERLAAALWPFYRAVFQELDQWLGALRKVAPPETIFALVSDHGMTWATRAVYIDRILQRAELIREDEKGRIDLAHSQVLTPAFGYFFVRVNDGRFRGGSVAEEDREAVLAAAEKALLEARDPETGAAMVLQAWRAEEVLELGGGGSAGGDLYFEVAPGYYPSRGLAKKELAGPRGRSGEHGFWPKRPSMQAVFYAAGPGLRRGVELPPIRQTDVAPTLARLMGIPVSVPEQPGACGSVLLEALAEAGR